MGKRLILLAGYLVFSVVFSFGFLGGGDGSPAPTEAFYSWGLLFAYLNDYNPIGCLVSYIVYLCILFLFTTFLSWQKKFRGDLVLVCFYLSGSVMAALAFGRGYDVPFLIFFSQYIVSIVVVIAYLGVDWRLAKKFNQSRSIPLKGSSSQD